MSEKFLDAVDDFVKDATEDKPEPKPGPGELTVDFEHFPSTVAGLCSCMILVLQALKISAVNAGDAAQVSRFQEMQILLRDQAAKTFPGQTWGKV